MNYKGDWNSMSLLTHELGHALHFYFSSRNQPFQLAEGKIFLTESIANFHQSLLRKYLLTTVDDQNLHKAILDDELMYFQNYCFYMPIVSKIETKMHEMVSHGQAISATFLSDYTRSCYSEGYGDAVNVNEYSGYVWMFCDELYKNFYAFQYLGGFAVGEALVKICFSEKTTASEKYMKLIKSGCSINQLELLKNFGIDFTKSKVLDTVFQTLSDRLELLKKYV
jgi:oligoendopeptidase F